MWGPVEKAIKYTYDTQKEKWTQEETRVRIARQKFSEGGMRDCFRMEEVENDGATVSCVAKFYKANIPANNDTFFSEAMAQCVADTFAQDYNRKDTPKKVAFLSCHVLKFFQRPQQPLATFELALEGHYEKHNNNYGSNFTRDETPQAFSHFTYEASNRTMLVCDIQGVGDFYTDPQIHTFDGQGFGLGNLGKKGITRFLETHTCNSICKRAGLPHMQARDPMAGMPMHMGMQGMPMGMGMMDMMNMMGAARGGGGVGAAGGMLPTQAFGFGDDFFRNMQQQQVRAGNSSGDRGGMLRVIQRLANMHQTMPRGGFQNGSPQHQQLLVRPSGGQQLRALPPPPPTHQPSEEEQVMMAMQASMKDLRLSPEDEMIERAKAQSLKDLHGHNGSGFNSSNGHAARRRRPEHDESNRRRQQQPPPPPRTPPLPPRTPPPPPTYAPPRTVAPANRGAVRSTQQQQPIYYSPQIYHGR